MNRYVTHLDWRLHICHWNKQPVLTTVCAPPQAGPGGGCIDQVGIKCIVGDFGDAADCLCERNITPTGAVIVAAIEYS